MRRDTAKVSAILSMCVAVQRFDALMDNLLDGRSVEHTIQASERSQPPKVLDWEAEPLPERWNVEQQQIWLSVWSQLDLSQVPGYPDWLRPTFHALCGALEEVLSVFSRYSRNGGQEGSLGKESWQRFTRDAALVTRALDAGRLTTIFLEASVETKLGEHVMRFPQFLQAPAVEMQPPARSPHKPLQNMWRDPAHPPSCPIDSRRSCMWLAGAATLCMTRLLCAVSSCLFHGVSSCS